MEPSTPFQLRRVLLGVVAGLVLVSLAFFGWVQYRRAQYDARARVVVGRYHESYRLCVIAGNYPPACAARTAAACVRDPFWSIGKPFSIDAADGSDRCRSGIASGQVYSQGVRRPVSAG